MTSAFEAGSLERSLAGLVSRVAIPYPDAHAISRETRYNPPGFDPIAPAKGVFITVHGHFYQPPRENPYLDAIERQPSAAPFHNWNERIHHECYRPNAFARILDDQGRVLQVVNNFEYMSFNIGPTLMSWLERHDVEVYQRILEADRRSCERLNGHGNAIAQAYNHMILPLANERDKRTQIRWGKADFRSRFCREPEGMWLAETAVDYATLEILIQEGIKFIVLAPSQARRCRPLPSSENPSPEWFEVGGSQIDPTRPYRCYLRPQADPNTHDPNGFASPPSLEARPYIDIFFYDGPISRDMGFDDGTLSSSHHFSSRLGQAIRGDHRAAQLIAVATDGETFGHHKGATEKCLAYAFIQEFPQRGWAVTNFAHYLAVSPPEWEVELKPVTAWSCAHGVDRWQDDCGCGGGGEWHQKWRRPLRDALDWLRDRLADIYLEKAQPLFQSPWVVRDGYVQVIRDRSPATIERFLSWHQSHPLSQAEQMTALRLLEMQRHALLMYTSCGWFFEELSRPEGVQILRYAARAMELAETLTGLHLETEFVQRLSLAPSNIEAFHHGGEVYRQLVAPAQVSLEQVTAHYAISSLFTPYPREQSIYCYTAQQVDYQLQRLGPLTLAVGQLELTSEITWEQASHMFAVLHLGGWDFHCCVAPFPGNLPYTELKSALFEALKQASAAQVIVTMNGFFGDGSYSLQNLFAEERHRIMRLLTQETLTRLDQLYTQVYRDNYGVLMAFHRDQLPVPQELQVAAEIALSQRVLQTLRALEQETDEASLGTERVVNLLNDLDMIATEAVHLHCQFTLPEARQILERLTVRSLWGILHQTDLGILQTDVCGFKRLIQLGDRLNLGVSLATAQELYLQYLERYEIPTLIPQILRSEEESQAFVQTLLEILSQLGDAIGVKV